jgi:polysaccharide export outer membrane protein
VGEVQAAGITPVQLGKAITEKLSTIMKEPKVDVSVTQVNSKRYYIQGEVNKAGAFPLIVPTTVLEALSNCGGFRDFANKKNIVILRKGQRLKFNYNDVIKGKNMEQNIYLEPGDYIIIP